MVKQHYSYCVVQIQLILLRDCLYGIDYPTNSQRYAFSSYSGYFKQILINHAQNQNIFVNLYMLIIINYTNLCRYIRFWRIF